MIFEDEEMTNPNLNLFLKYIIVLSYFLELKEKENLLFFNFETVFEKSIFFELWGPLIFITIFDKLFVHACVLNTYTVII